MSKFLVSIYGLKSLILDDHGNSEIGIWDMIYEQYPVVCMKIDSKDIYDITKIE